jgi:hypothetical protein
MTDERLQFVYRHPDTSCQLECKSYCRYVRSSITVGYFIGKLECTWYGMAQAFLLLNNFFSY